MKAPKGKDNGTFPDHLLVVIVPSAAVLWRLEDGNSLTLKEADDKDLKSCEGHWSFS